MKRNPSFAIVKIPEGANVGQFYQLLIESGFSEVAFVNEVRDNVFVPNLDLNEALHRQPLTIKTGDIEERNGNCSVNGGSIGSVEQHSPESVTEKSSGGTGTIAAAMSSISEAAVPLTSSTPNTTNGGTPTVPSPYPFVARPRGSRSAGTVEDSSIYTACNLCQNKIMSSRLSNLTNHVRRHASLKQYQCRHCVYSHNEISKVRLHMQNNHRDYTSQPIDQISPEMQLQWNSLMEQCFPEHAKRLGQNRGTSPEPDSPGSVMKTVSADQQYRCVECSELVKGSKLLEHLKDAHHKECAGYNCPECEYESSNEWKVRLHIVKHHADRAAEVSPSLLPAGHNYAIFVHRFFPDVPGSDEDDFGKGIVELCDSSGRSDGEASKSSSDAMQMVKCELCDKMVASNQPLSNLMNHAKRHYIVKQFRCPECSHSCVENASMRTHIAIKHPGTNAEPLDIYDEDLQSAWIDVLKQCFPSLSDRIDNYQFRYRESSAAPIKSSKEPPTTVADALDSGSLKRQLSPELTASDDDSLSLPVPDSKSSKESSRGSPTPERPRSKRIRQRKELATKAY
ncbi:zinc finger protein [Aphelenchoides avenae]|nr:zinc finger protein [Aphelenchus avenae]